MHTTLRSRQDFINAVLTLQIPKIGIARMTGLDQSRISEYLRGKSLTADKVEKIESAVSNIVKVWTVLPVKVDINDREGFARAVQIADNAIAQSELENLIGEAGEAFEIALSRKVNAARNCLA